MKTIELSTQPPSLEAVLEAAAKEAGVVLTESGEPVAHVIPLPRAVKQRTAPLHPGAWTVGEDFDECCSLVTCDRAVSQYPVPVIW